MPAAAPMNLNSAAMTNSDIPSVPVPGMPIPTMNEVEVKAAVIRQIEYYLGQENLGRDFYLRQRMTPDFWAPLEVLLQFPKMKKLGMTDIESVANLLREGSSQVVVDDLGLFVRPAWAVPMTGMAMPPSVAGQKDQKSVLLLKDIPTTVDANIVMQAFRDIPKCPSPVSTHAEGEFVYAVVFSTLGGAQIALDLAAGTMIAGKYPIKGHVRVEPQAPNTSSGPPNMVPLPNAPRSPYSPHVMLSPLPLQSPFGYGMPPPGFGGFVQSPRNFYPNGGMYPGGPMYGIDETMSPGTSPMTPNGATTPMMAAQPGVPNGHVMPAQGGMANDGVGSPHVHGNGSGPGMGHGMNGNRNAVGRNHHRNRRANGNANYGKGSTYGGEGSSPTSANGVATSGYDNNKAGNVTPKIGNVKNGRTEKTNVTAGSANQGAEGGRKGGYMNGNNEKRRGKGRRRSGHKEDGTKGESRRDGQIEDKKAERPKKEAQISTMYFPPLPGSNEAAAGVMTAGKSDTSTAKNDTGSDVDGAARNESMKIDGGPGSKNVAIGSQVGSARHQGDVSTLGDQAKMQDENGSPTSTNDKFNVPISPKEDSGRRDSLPGGMSYAEILRARKNASSLQAPAKSSTGTASPRSVSGPESTKRSTEETEAKTNPISTLTSPRTSSANLGESMVPETERKVESKVTSTNSTTGAATTQLPDEVSQSSVSKAGSTVDSSTPSDNDSHSIDSSVPESQEMKTPVKTTIRSGSAASEKPALSPSGSVWANKPRSVLQAAPITPSAKVNVSQKTAPKTPRSTAAKKNGSSNKSNKAGKGKSGNHGEKNPRGTKSNGGANNESKPMRRKDGGANSKGSKSEGTRIHNDATKPKNAVSPKGAWALGGPVLNREGKVSDGDAQVHEVKAQATAANSDTSKAQ
eukprot:Plantae.Rhodophyta-Hildenbrandia_rubra.ctg2569.p1 GENE.Plantae.Rhodophyta-Hildenbrandia_rubra.ctg2569~~Plantae.Rhodophyta-Hildenbrandia_rubra.ctg2569.p1  ORF type:complete len:929 (+),score=175.75 Plantae.Rhodophyta-Hildenbrandia_rubra.ctg2569:62-2788(+)